MGWQRFLGSAVVVFCLTQAGCETSASPRTLARDQVLQDPEMMSVIYRNSTANSQNVSNSQGSGNGQPGTESTPPPVTRGQKPDLRPPTPLLDAAPDRQNDVSYGQRAATIVAIVNNQAILDEEVRSNAFRDLAQAGLLPEPDRSRRLNEVFTEALNRIVDRELVLQEMFDLLKKNPKGGERVINKLQEAARESFENQLLKPMKAANHLKTDEEARRIFAEQGLSLYSIRRQFERNFMEREYLSQRIVPLLDTRVNHQMIAEYYDKHPEEFQVSDSVQWQDLFIAASKYASRAEARSFAESLAEQARNGTDFAQLVKEHDDGDSSLRGGAGVGSKHGEIRPSEAEETLFTLADGTVGPIIELPSGFHVIKVVHLQKAGQLPFDNKVQKQIRDKLRNEASQAEVKRIVSNLKAKAVIEIARRTK